MRNFLQTVYGKFHHLILYGIIGSCTALLDFLIFTLLTKSFSVFYLYANIVSCGCGILASFLLNRKYNFKVTDHTVRRMAIFFAVGIFGMFLSSVILHYCIDVLGFGSLLSKLISIVVVVIIQFILNKYISFRQQNKTENYE